MAIKSSQQLGLSGVDRDISLLKAQGRKAVGGTVTYSGGYTIHTFTATTQFTVLDQKLNTEYLIVAGGGGANGFGGGGAGGGGVIYGNILLTTQTYTITVGGGGTAGSNSDATSGSISTAFNLTAYGGGLSANDTFANGGSGGSGGGSGTQALGTGVGGLGIVGQGTKGGDQDSQLERAGGGGGAGSEGQKGTTNASRAGDGGLGLSSTISGTATYYGGGGGGGNRSSTGSPAYTVRSGGNGGAGGGGKGSDAATNNPVAGTVNTGGGGGGGQGYQTANPGAAGGSGIIIVRYKTDTTQINITKSVTYGITTDLDISNPYSYSPLTVDYFVVSGGGGGGTSGANYCGGGGASGVLSGTMMGLLVGSYAVVVAAGGGAASNGGTSSFNGISPTGGGAGSSSYATAGNNGGSGGGGAPINAIGGTGIYGQGFKGGNSSSANQGGGDSGAGGGGGAGGPGYNLDSFPFTNGPGAGGPGIQSSISGTATFYAAGGAGSGYYYTDSVNGIGGGANGANGTASRLTGAANTGSGGGGGRSGTGNAGGSGVVIIRYKGSQKATGGTITSSNGYTIHTFTGSGTFTVTSYTINDMSGNGNDGTLTNGAFYDSSNGGSIYLDGVNDYISLPAAAGRLNNNDFTISVWWKSNGAQSNYATILGQGFTGGPSNGAWAFKVQGGSSIINFSYYYEGISDNTTSTNPNDGVWHNIVAIRSGATVTLYMDNTSIGSFTLNSYFVFGTTDTVYVGYNPRDAVYTKGWVSNIQIYNRAMTTSELLQSYNTSRGKFGI